MSARTFLTFPVGTRYEARVLDDPDEGLTCEIVHRDGGHLHQDVPLDGPAREQAAVQAIDHAGLHRLTRVRLLEPLGTLSRPGVFLAGEILDACESASEHEERQRQEGGD